MLDVLKEFIDLFLHLDKHLDQILLDYGTWTYLILFLIIFVETGVVVMPFLPGDSLLFVAGMFAARDGNPLNIWALIGLLFVAAFLGDTLNYIVGKTLGNTILSRNYRFIKKEYVEQTHAFYEKHGGKTIIYARFVPIVRTFAPFVAGISEMNYGKFLSFNVIGGFVWVALFLLGGYFLGSVEWIKNNVTFIALGIVVVSVMPPIVQFIKQKYSK
ncbi:membrane-associated protein [Flexibacter flexilis DSM 6793]|uniref:Membrane-associated protein n=1 Tax=Flexibacter flexilis DSM 6793 TaxID=927664 RepID=A0A1I1G4P0_9BACT|nr:DedA family protein [Flexibacter flexilis]SFC06471.1 membrane-associated protein [Flexibacter flexilis DSM 6793]